MNTVSVDRRPRREVLALLAQNLGLRGSVLPLPTRYLTAWAKGLSLPRGGRVVLYTGHMYQMLPVIRAMEEKARALAPEKRDRLASLARLVNPLVNLSGLARFIASCELKIRSNRILRNIVLLLREAGVNPGYLYEAEKYAGALAYDLGLDGPFERHAWRVVKRLRRFGVREIITVDPHTTQIFKEVYPQVVASFDFEVRSYIEVLAEKGLKAKVGWEGSLVFHDSCVYARYLGVLGEPRKLLAEAGVTVKEPDFSKELTHCCGGPVESLFPEKAEEVARRRFQELSQVGSQVVCACPICLLNLDMARGPCDTVFDLSEVLAASFLGAEK